MRKNVIILTSGLSGSSVITGLIARGGYWIGESTFKKPDYETFENQDLIDLDKRLFREGEFTGNYAFDFSQAAIERIGGLADRIDTSVYREFVERCNQHTPWLWKDPRLWMTIRFWKNLMDLDRCAFVFWTRDVTQVWMSALLRRQILTYRSAHAYETSIHRSLVQFLKDNGLPYLPMAYEDLIARPAEAIDKLNAHLDSALTVEDLRSVYKGPLNKSPRYSWGKQSKAMLIYWKNYFQRLDVVE